MRICRFNHDRIGVVQDDMVIDVTDLFDLQPRWPLPSGDWIIRQMPEVMPRIRDALPRRHSIPLASVRLASPVAEPGKIIGAPINYKAHIDEANADHEINQGKTYTSLDEFGLFLKANSSLVGPSDAVQSRFKERRTDHEVELAVIIGKEASHVRREDALEHVFGYAVGLDMTVRGKEFPSFRKSVDTYSVLGPWIVTADEVTDPNELTLHLSVNGEERQRSNTRHLIFNVQRLIEYASAFYTLHPGDVIMTGTPDGVSPVLPGDVIEAEVEGIGRLTIAIDPRFSDDT